MTREEFISRYRGRMLLLLTEAWAARREPPGALGLLVDQHALSCKHLLVEMYDALVTEHPCSVTEVSQNGTPRTPRGIR